jgi:hypothetical protein
MRLFASGLLLGLVGLAWSVAGAQEDSASAGTFEKPPSNGLPLKHSGTGLSFPQVLGNHRMLSEFRFKEGGGKFVRYESQIDRSRADIFLFPHTKVELSEEDTRGAINNELDTVVAQFQAMANEGRYKNLVLDDPADGEIPLWPEGSLPLSVRSLVATKLADTREGPKEVQVKQWIGVTLLKGHLVTIRYTHPTDTGEAGEQALKAFAGMVFQVIKDPPLRDQIRELVKVYAANPLSPDGEQAAAAVLAYVQKTPFVNVPIPNQPLVTWLEHFKQEAPGTETQLLRAFAMGSAQLGLEEKSPEECLNAGAKQFLYIYGMLLSKHPTLRHPGVVELAAAVQAGDGAGYLLKNAQGAK